MSKKTRKKKTFKMAGGLQIGTANAWRNKLYVAVNVCQSTYAKCNQQKNVENITSLKIMY